jgi:hypothetical protein
MVLRMIIEVLKVFLEAVRLIAGTVRVARSYEIGCIVSIRGKVQALRVLVEAVGVIVEALKRL